MFSARAALWRQCPRDLVHEDLLPLAIKAPVLHTVVDVREPHEFAGGHVPGAINLPLSRFRLENLPAGKPPVLICLSGARSGSAVRHAHSNGATHVCHYARGMNDWRARGGPIVR